MGNGSKDQGWMELNGEKCTGGGVMEMEMEKVDDGATG